MVCAVVLGEEARGSALVVGVLPLHLALHTPVPEHKIQSTRPNPTPRFDPAPHAITSTRIALFLGPRLQSTAPFEARASGRASGGSAWAATHGACAAQTDVDRVWP